MKKEIYGLISKLASQVTIIIKKKHTELAEALAIGKQQANAMVENQALKNSLGYEYIEEVVSTKKEVLYENGKRLKEITEPVKIQLTKHKTSDQAAVKYWLNNQDPKNWKEKQDINLGNTDDKPLNLNFSNISTEELRRLLADEDKE